MDSAAKPGLQQVLEGVATVLGLNHGREPLELIFADGQLELYYTHHEKRRPGELAEYEREAERLLESL